MKLLQASEAVTRSSLNTPRRGNGPLSSAIAGVGNYYTITLSIDILTILTFTVVLVLLSVLHSTPCGMDAQIKQPLRSTSELFAGFLDSLLKCYPTGPSIFMALANSAQSFTGSFAAPLINAGIWSKFPPTLSRRYPKSLFDAVSDGFGTSCLSDLSLNTAKAELPLRICP